MPRCYSMILMLFGPMWCYVMPQASRARTRTAHPPASKQTMPTCEPGSVVTFLLVRHEDEEHTYVCLTAPVGLSVRQFNSIWHVLGQYCLLSTIKHHPSQLYQCCLQLDVGQNWVPNNGMICNTLLVKIGKLCEFLAIEFWPLETARYSFHIIPRDFWPDHQPLEFSDASSIMS